MIQLLLHVSVSLYIAVLVSIPQVKIRISFRFHVVSHLPAVIEESTLRVQGKTSYFDWLFVHGKVSFIQLLPGAQIWRWPRLMMMLLLLVRSGAFILTVISSPGISVSSVC